ncbi:hypothetical protein [Prosthecobacter vanneervenii]|uniref:Uncharacterized protein n=1 Tax=Prosthecobacter vanneervenii TaxID=48466 RepID=A0A7W7YBH8_9BACT|nr:hypothetical protein [Prosthecobacter vanneervenii]MBB5033134.1 hypothetical protein [Prosthecobacter vanneervenii]
MKQPESHHFHNGKAARAAGKPCHISDARMSHQSRTEWYAGWNYQDAAMRPAPTAEELYQNEGFFSELKASLRKAP